MRRHRICGLVAMTSASHAEGRQFDPGQVYFRSRQATSHVETSGRKMRRGRPTLWRAQRDVVQKSQRTASNSQELEARVGACRKNGKEGRENGEG